MLIGVVGAGFGGLAGCYHHVVRAEGTSPGEFKVYEPNLKDDRPRSSNNPFDRKLPPEEKK